MAVYNGSLYLSYQIASILNQLSDNDELIIVDDCSTDNSSDLITELKDSRIKYYKNDINIGVFGTFERAINLSSGDKIFLSDQDDIWYPHKIEKVMAIFNTMEKITMVATDATMIDSEGEITHDSFISKRGKFKSDIINTIIKNKYLGCTLAFRRTIVDKLLPIPANVPMHDIWFGAINSIYGKTYFIDEPLIFYRRHNNNVSPSEPVNLLKQLRWRYDLVANILLRSFLLRKKDLV